MTVYTPFIATAIKLIDRYGRTCYWQKPAPYSAGEPGYPDVGALPNEIECRMAFFSPRDLDRGVMDFLGMMPGTEVPDNAQIGLLAGGISFTPENTDHIYLDEALTQALAIEKIDRIAPSGEPVLYFVTVAA